MNRPILRISAVTSVAQTKATTRTASRDFGVKATGQGWRVLARRAHREGVAWREFYAPRGQATSDFPAGDGRRPSGVPLGITLKRCETVAAPPMP